MSRKKKKEERKDVFYKNAKNLTQKAKQDFVKNTVFYNKQEISERLYRMILYAIGRHDWYDDRQHRLLNIGLALIASSGALAVVGVRITGSLTPLSTIFGLALVLCILGTGLSLVHSYNRQMGRNHPYRKLVDIRSWYFIYTFPSPLKDHLSSEFSRAKKQIEQTMKAYEVYMSRWLDWASDRDRFIEEDLEQVFILQLLQRYRYQGLKTMSKRLFCGLYIGSILLVLTIVANLFNWGL